MGTTPIIHEETLYECWKKLNNHLFENGDFENSVEDIETPWVLKRDFGLSVFNVTLRADKGFGLPEKNLPFFNYEKRLKTLRNRYVDPPLWQEGIDRLIAKGAGGKLAAPMTFTILFHRNETSEASVPTGGGCLVCFNIVNFKKQHRLHITMRASEITCRLLSDMYFFQMMFREVHQQVKKVMPKLDPDNLPIDITILLASQVKHYLPVFWVLTEGVDKVEEIMFNEPKTLWQKDVINHFWEEFVFPENINWSQRKKWSEVFYKYCAKDRGEWIDWRSLLHMRGDKDMLPKPKQFRGKYNKYRPWDDAQNDEGQEPEPEKEVKQPKAVEAPAGESSVMTLDFTEPSPQAYAEDYSIVVCTKEAEGKRPPGRPKGRRAQKRQAAKEKMMQLESSVPKATPETELPMGFNVYGDTPKAYKQPFKLTF